MATGNLFSCQFCVGLLTRFVITGHVDPSASVVQEPWTLQSERERDQAYGLL